MMLNPLDCCSVGGPQTEIGIHAGNSQWDLRTTYGGLRSTTANGLWGQEEEKGNGLGVHALFTATTVMVSAKRNSTSSTNMSITMSNAALLRIFWQQQLRTGQTLARAWMALSIWCTKYHKELLKENTGVIMCVPPHVPLSLDHSKARIDRQD